MARGSIFQAYLYLSSMELLSLGKYRGKPSLVKGNADMDLRDNSVVKVV